MWAMDGLGGSTEAHVMEPDWWRGRNGRWYAPYLDDEFGGGLPAPKVTGRRVGAALIDLIPLTLLFVGLATRFGEFTVNNGFTVYLFGWSAVRFMATVVAYFLVTEALTGTSPGKRVMSLQVSLSNGSAIGWSKAAIRNALRIIDAFPVPYVVGIIAIWSTETNQRLGDLAASTVVHPLLGHDDERASKAKSTALLAGMAAATALVGVLLIAAGPPPPSLGDIPVDPDVDAFVAELMESTFVPMDINALIDHAAPELSQLNGFEDVFALNISNPGPLIGSYEVLEVVVDDWMLPDGRTYPAAEYLIRGEFRDGEVPLRLAVVNRDGNLQVVAWNLSLA